MADDVGIALDAKMFLDGQKLGHLAATKECIDPKL
jgi:hypothetical protein